MEKENKIIPFKKRKKANYELKAKIAIHIIRKDENFKIYWNSPDKISEEQIYQIQTKIFNRLIKQVNFIKYKTEESYDLEITLLYFEKAREFNYICIPQNITPEKLAEILMISTNLYELKKTSTY